MNSWYLIRTFKTYNIYSNDIRANYTFSEWDTITKSIFTKLHYSI